MGKSTVARLFRELGAVTLDLDEIVDGLLREDFIIEKIRGIFGDSVVSGKGLNRSRIAELIFTDRDKRELLEGLLHPLVIQRMRDFLERMDKGEFIVIEIPLLFEKGYEGEFDRTLTVYTDVETSLKRLENKGLKREEALMRIQAQMPIEEKIRMSDFVIDNNGSMEDTKKQVLHIYKTLKESC